MAIVFSIEKNGVVSQTIPKGSKMTVGAKSAETYRIVDTETGRSPVDVKAKRVGDSLIIDSQSNQVSVEVQGFWSECSSGINQCFMMVDSPAVAGGELVGQSIITQTSVALDSLVAGQVGTLGVDAVIAAPVLDSVAATTGVLGTWSPNAGFYALGAGVVGLVIRKEEMGDSIFRGIKISDPLTVDITSVTFDKNMNSVVSGVTDKNATVVVTFPDGSTATTLADADGKFVVTSAKPQVDGAVNVVATLNDRTGSDASEIAHLAATRLSKTSEQWDIGAWYDHITTVPGDPAKLASGNALLIFDVGADSKPQAGQTLHVYLRQAPTGETEEHLNTAVSARHEVASSYDASTGQFKVTDLNVFSPTAANGNVAADGYYYISYDYTDASGAIVAASNEYRFGIDPWKKYPFTASPDQPVYQGNGVVDNIVITKADADKYGDHVSSATPLIDKEYMLYIDSTDLVKLKNDANGVWSEQGVVIIPTVNLSHVVVSTETYIRYDNSGSTTDVLVLEANKNQVTII